MSHKRPNTSHASLGGPGMVFPGEDLLADDPIARESYRERLSIGAVGGRIRAARAAAGLSQSALARRIGTTQAHLSATERGMGAHGPTYAMLRRVADACGTTPASLVDDCAGSAPAASDTYPAGVDLGASCSGAGFFAARAAEPSRPSVGDIAAGPDVRVAALGPLELRPDSREVKVSGQKLHLTPKEYALLELLVLKRGTSLSKSACLNHLYGAEEEPELKTVDVIAARLRKKLAAAGLPSLVENVWGDGYRLAVSLQRSRSKTAV